MEGCGKLSFECEGCNQVKSIDGFVNMIGKNGTYNFKKKMKYRLVRFPSTNIPSTTPAGVEPLLKGGDSLGIGNSLGKNDDEIKTYSTICKRCFFLNNRYGFNDEVSGIELTNKELRDAMKGTLRIRLNLDEYIKDWNEFYKMRNKIGEGTELDHLFKKVKIEVHCEDATLDKCYNDLEKKFVEKKIGKYGKNIEEGLVDVVKFTMYKSP